MSTSEKKANHTETRATDTGGMLEAPGPTILRLWKLRPGERKGLVQGHVEVSGRAKAYTLPCHRSFNDDGNNNR